MTQATLVSRSIRYFNLRRAAERAHRAFIRIEEDRIAQRAWDRFKMLDDAAFRCHVTINRAAKGSR